MTAVKTTVTMQQATYLEPAERPQAYNMNFDVNQLPPDEELECDPPSPAMVDSVMRYGLLEPVVVRVDEREEGFVVVDGRGRIKAARAALWRWASGVREVGGVPVSPPSRTIPARVYPDLSSYVAAMLSLVANAQRRRNPASDVRAIEALLRQGMTEEGIRAQTGLSASTYRQRVGLMRLTPMLRTALEKGMISSNFAEAAARLPRGLQEELEGELANRKPTLALIGEIRQARDREAQASLPEEIWGVPADVEMRSEPQLLRLRHNVTSAMATFLRAMPERGDPDILYTRNAVTRALQAMERLDERALLRWSEAYEAHEAQARKEAAS